MNATVVAGSVPIVDPGHADLELRRTENWLEELHLVDELATLSAHLTAATARFVELVWEHRERFGCDVARFVAFKCGITGREAAEYVRVAEALQELPVTRAAFARGEISLAKVRALTRVATASSEEGLLELAGALTATQLHRALRAYRRVTVEEARDAHELEYVSYWFAEDGSLMLRARLAAEDGTVVVKALDAAHERVLAGRREEGGAAATDPRTSRADAGYGPADPALGPPRSSRVEALIEVAHAALETPDGPGGPCPAAARVIVHLDAAVLGSDVEGRSELEDGPVITPETARRLGCDAEVVAQIERDSLPLSVGRTRRTVPPTLRRLLEARDHTTCRFPGCERRRHLQAHDRRHWANGGHTSLDNLVLLCSHHHRLVHEGGYTIHDDPAGGLLFRNRRGITCANLPSRPPPASADDLIAHNERLGLEINPTTNRHGCGSLDPFDLELTVSAISSIMDLTGEHAHLPVAA